MRTGTLRHVLTFLTFLLLPAATPECAPPADEPVLVEARGPIVPRTHRAGATDPDGDPSRPR